MNSQIENIGYWNWTWETDNQSPEGTTLSIAFSGYSNAQEAINNSLSKKDKLSGEKYISVGGGNEAGAFTQNILESLTLSIQNGDFEGYDGIAYDVEEGESGLENYFAASFQAAKNKGLKVLVTVSHSAPYGISDARELMYSFFSNENIDIISPQLYTTGQELENDYDTSQGVLWNDYENCKAAIVPSIVKASMYINAQEYFARLGLTLQGYIQWSQNK
ncbi:hypothetical protein PG911_08125 [Tenacibaculum ovolyticum]|uniref:hypothetical protein n=1 Tax=Tenacibaculum ovolyticum TaxID=104270 RepID=UPI0022F38F1C|nr:hypothetical protein [Tenacibaculum ovolyticum]WBX78209.1 hypothetical protein PG911_08125 [Tenacibaculum ovolyticum]